MASAGPTEFESVYFLSPSGHANGGGGPCIIEISHDNDPESPRRSMHNFSTMLLWYYNENSPDENKYPNPEEFLAEVIAKNGDIRKHLVDALEHNAHLPEEVRWNISLSHEDGRAELREWDDVVATWPTDTDMGPDAKTSDILRHADAATEDIARAIAELPYAYEIMHDDCVLLPLIYDVWAPMSEPSIRMIGPAETGEQPNGYAYISGEDIQREWGHLKPELARLDAGSAALDEVALYSDYKDDRFVAITSYRLDGRADGWYDNMSVGCGFGLAKGSYARDCVEIGEFADISDAIDALERHGAELTAARVLSTGKLEEADLARAHRAFSPETGERVLRFEPPIGGSGVAVKICGKRLCTLYQGEGDFVECTNAHPTDCMIRDACERLNDMEKSTPETWSRFLGFASDIVGVELPPDKDGYEACLDLAEAIRVERDEQEIEGR